MIDRMLSFGSSAKTMLPLEKKNPQIFFRSTSKKVVQVKKKIFNAPHKLQETTPHTQTNNQELTQMQNSCNGAIYLLLNIQKGTDQGMQASKLSGKKNHDDVPESYPQRREYSWQLAAP
jgi:hypothetical protein